MSVLLVQGVAQRTAVSNSLFEVSQLRSTRASSVALRLAALPDRNGRGKGRLRQPWAKRAAVGVRAAFGWAGMTRGREAPKPDAKLAATRARADQLLDDAQTAGAVPGLFVFDLDYTMWPFFCDCKSPRMTPYTFPDFPAIFAALEARGIPMAIASRSHTPDIAQTFLHGLGLSGKFVVQEIYPSGDYKAGHFREIQRKTSMPYSSMVFFDDERGNIEMVSKMGVTCVYVENGVNLDALQACLQQFARAQGQATP